MGGQSFKCPHCEQWYLEKGRLRDHLIGKHGEPRGFELVGVASATHILRRTTVTAGNRDPLPSGAKDPPPSR